MLNDVGIKLAFAMWCEDEEDLEEPFEPKDNFYLENKLKIRLQILEA